MSQRGPLELKRPSSSSSRRPARKYETVERARIDEVLDGLRTQGRSLREAMALHGAAAEGFERRRSTNARREAIARVRRARFSSHRAALDKARRHVPGGRV